MPVQLFANIFYSQQGYHCTGVNNVAICPNKHDIDTCLSFPAKHSMQNQVLLKIEEYYNQLYTLISCTCAYAMNAEQQVLSQLFVQCGAGNSNSFCDPCRIVGHLTYLPCYIVMSLTNCFKMLYNNIIVLCKWQLSIKRR